MRFNGRATHKNGFIGASGKEEGNRGCYASHDRGPTLCTDRIVFRPIHPIDPKTSYFRQNTLVSVKTRSTCILVLGSAPSPCTLSCSLWYFILLDKIGRASCR